MFTVRPNIRNRGGGFTLLEIVLAVAILGMIAVAIYRFVVTNVIAVSISSREIAADARYTGFVSLLTTQMADLSSDLGSVAGEPFKFSDQSQDEINWRCGAGPGLLTRYAAGEYLVTMRMKRSEKDASKMEIGFMRKPSDDPDGSDEGTTWVPLLEDARGLEIRYYDPRLPAWVDKWTDTRVMPRLVRFVVSRPDRAEPLEAVIALARTPLEIRPPSQQQQQQQQQQPGTGTQPAPGQQPGQPPLATPPPRSGGPTK